ncbi:Hypothetical protein NocV09_00103010 [Nannochloropsis oceanica]
MTIESVSELQAAASLFGSVCVDSNLAFYEQKKKDPHPLACEAASKDVKACWESLRAKIKATSEGPFQSYAQCLQTTGNNLKKCAELHDQLVKAFEEATQ